MSYSLVFNSFRSLKSVRKCVKIHRDSLQLQFDRKFSHSWMYSRNHIKGLQAQLLYYDSILAEIDRCCSGSFPLCKEHIEH